MDSQSIEALAVALDVLGQTGEVVPDAGITPVVGDDATAVAVNQSA
jgi:hypothetical protein